MPRLQYACKLQNERRAGVQPTDNAKYRLYAAAEFINQFGHATKQFVSVSKLVVARIIKCIAINKATNAKRFRTQTRNGRS